MAAIEKMKVRCAKAQVKENIDRREDDKDARKSRDKQEDIAICDEDEDARKLRTWGPLEE